MRERVLVISLLTTLVSLSAPPSVLAQDMTFGDDETGGDVIAEEQARELFLEGAQAYQNENYQDAADSFEASYAIRPVPVVLFNLAQALRFLGRRAEAAEAFRQYLVTEENVPVERQAAIDAAVAELEAALAQVTVYVNRAGAHITVDGRDVGQAPMDEPVILDPGSYTFEASMDGESSSRTLDVAAGDQRILRLSLETSDIQGSIRITSNQPEAQVDIGDRGYGRVPVEVMLSIGRHTVRVTADGFDPYEETILLEEGRTSEVNADFSGEADEGGGSKWWLWAVLGAVVVGGVVTAVVLTAGSDEPPVNGTLPTINALEFGP